MTDDALLKHYERQFGPFIHMAPRDKAIWLRYLILGGGRYAPFQYDLRVGTGTEMPADADRFAVSAAFALTTKRIDVVAEFESEIFIIEVKQRAGLSSIGQLIGYKYLYEQTYNPVIPVRMLLITDQLQPDMVAPLITNNIGYVEVGL